MQRLENGVDQILEESQCCEVLRTRRVASEEAEGASWGRPQGSAAFRPGFVFPPEQGVTLS